MTETEIIACSYFDGATEGLARSVSTVGPCYFKVIAWDDSQDQRLFAAVPIEPFEFEIGMAEVRGDSNPTSTGVQILSYTESSDGKDDAFDRLVRDCQERLRDSGILLLGPQVNAPEATLIPIGDALRTSVVEALCADNPEDLLDWLPRLD